MDDFEAAQERLHARQMEFLKNSSPDDWHRYAFFFNWNERLDGLFWIVGQPECDRSTALLIFWKGEPTGYDYEEEDEPMGDDIYAVAPMLRFISERFNSGGYSRAEIAYDFLEATGHDAGSEYASMIEAGRLRDFEALVERQEDVPNARVKLHPDMMVLRVPGRKVGGYDDHSDFYDRFPEDDDGFEAAAAAAPDLSDNRRFVPADRTGDRRADEDADPSARIRALRHRANPDGDEAADASQATGVAGWFKGLFRR